jgi:hypothetical protein
MARTHLSLCFRPFFTVFMLVYSHSTEQFFRLVTFGIALLTFGGCSSSKKDDATPVAPTGSIQGIVGPPGAATLATATDKQNQVFTAVPDRKTGVYTFNKVAPGFCTIYFTAAPGFSAHTSATPIVQADQTVQAGVSYMMFVGAVSLHGNVAWQYDGSLTTAAQQLAGNLSADSLRIEAVSSSGYGTDVLLRVKPFTGVGTYPLNTGNNTAVFRRYLPTGVVTYLSNSAATSGTLTITSYDAARRTLNGTFSFSANALPPATGTAAVTSGTLYNVQFP